MQSILEEFACGNISPEPCYFRCNSEYGQAIKKLSSCEEKLSSKLNESEKELLEEFISTQSDINHMSCVDRFVYGYRLGVLMTMEVFEGKENLIVGREGY